MVNKPYFDIYAGQLIEDKQGVGTGETSTNDYEGLANKPKVNGHILSGNKTPEELGLVDKTTEQTIPGIKTFLNGMKLSGMLTDVHGVNIISTENDTTRKVGSVANQLKLASIDDIQFRKGENENILTILTDENIIDHAVTLDTPQVITPLKTFKDIKIDNNELTIGDGTKNDTTILLKANNATLEVASLDYTSDDATIAVGSSLAKTMIRGEKVVDSNNNEFLTALNLPIATVQSKGVIKPDGKTLTITADGTLKATGVGTATEQYGIRGDYATQYGILECPNGILTVSGMKVTLQPMVVMQCAGQESKTTITGKLDHTITSTDDIDLFYVGGQLLECGDVFYQEAEPDNGVTNFLAWWKPSLGKWQFKSNNTGNVWKEAVACRLAHIHTDGNTITRVDYIGNRILDDEIFALQSDVDTALANKADKTELPAEARLLKGASLYPVSNLATDATLAQTIQKVNEIIAILVSRGIARIQ